MIKSGKDLTFIAMAILVIWGILAGPVDVAQTIGKSYRALINAAAPSQPATTVGQ